MKRTSKMIPKLISEDYPSEYSGYLFLSLVQYNKEKFLTVIDNADDNNINCFILELCGPESIDQALFLNIANDWFNSNYNNYPLSIEFAKRGLSQYTSRILRTFNIEFVSRVIGPIQKFSMNGAPSVKRKKKRVVEESIKVEAQPAFIDF